MDRNMRKNFSNVCYGLIGFTTPTFRCGILSNWKNPAKRHIHVVVNFDMVLFMNTIYNDGNEEWGRFSMQILVFLTKSIRRIVRISD